MLFFPLTFVCFVLHSPMSRVNFNFDSLVFTILWSLCVFVLAMLPYVRYFVCVVLCCCLCAISVESYIDTRAHTGLLEVLCVFV